MVFPYANRAAVASLPALALAAKPATVKEVIEDFSKQCPHESLLESVQLIKGRTIRVVFASVEVMEDIVSGGLTFRHHPITFKTPSVYKWVTLLDLPYGTPEGEIKTALSKFGQVAHVRSETYMGLYTGTKFVKIEVKTAIPSRIAVAGHPCSVFYRGQIRSCFRCGNTGHEARKCPQKTPAASGPTVTTTVVPPAARSETTMSTTPPSSPRTFAGVVSGQTPSTETDVQTLGSVPSETLPLPTSPIRGLTQDPPGMDTEVHSQKRPLSPASESEGTDTIANERTRPRLEEQPPTGPTILDPGIRDRSPLRTAATGTDSTSDSSGKSLTSNASVSDLPAAQLAFPEEPLVPLGPSLDRRPLSTRYREYCSTAPEYTAVEAEELVLSILETERQLESPSEYDQEALKLEQDYDHLQLDRIIAVTVCATIDENDPKFVILEQALTDADEALASFAAAYPEVVRAAAEMYGEIPSVNEPALTDIASQSSVTPSSSLVIPDGQPSRTPTVNPSTDATPLPPGEGETDSTETSTNAGSLKTHRRSGKKTHSETELASCVRHRTAPALPGARKKQQPPPDSPYTPLVTDSGYLVTHTSSSTLPTRPQRPDTGAAGAISPSPSSDSHP